MAHTINIPDALWDLYDGSPSAMRDTLWQAKVAPPEDEPAASPEPGTVITLRWSTSCSVCRKRLMRGEQAVIRSRNDGTDGNEIVCLDDGRQGLMDLNLSDELAGF